MRGRWRDAVCPRRSELRGRAGLRQGALHRRTPRQAEPDALLIAVEKVPDAMVVAMERVTDAGLSNVFFVDGGRGAAAGACSPRERWTGMYINFCDPWPKSNQKKRRLTHGNFLKKYRQVLADGRADPL